MFPCALLDHTSGGQSWAVFGIVVVALVFLPIMRSRAMQFFQTEGFDTLGKVLPRIRDISKSLLTVYIGLTFPAAATWMLVFGMLLGRLEILSIFVLFTPAFWRV